MKIIMDLPTIVYLNPDIIINSNRNNSPFEYIVRGRDKDSCPICGKPNKKENCQFHKYPTQFSFNLIFGGYYEIKDTGEPLNEFTKAYFDLLKHKFPIIKEEILRICEIRFNYEFKYLLDIQQKSNFVGTWIPTSNKISIEIAKSFFDKILVKYLEPELFCEFNHLALTKSDKYILKKNENLTDFKKVWIIFDDVYHKGDTFARIMEIIQVFHPSRVIGIVILRTGETELSFINFP